MSKSQVKQVTRPPNPNGLFPKNVGPYTGVQIDETRTFNLRRNGRRYERTFRVLSYQAYNAYGLIGSEYNGVCILDEDARQVIADELGKVGSGWFGVTQSQVDLINQLLSVGFDKFESIINSSRRNRFRRLLDLDGTYTPTPKE